jgi:P-type E1-E2 ATPase
MIHMGSLAFMEDLGFVSADLREEIRQLIGRGGSQLFLAINTELAAGFLMADNIRTDAAAAIKRLQSAGRKVVMLSGDNRLTAEEVAAQIGIEEVISGVLPHEKADHIKSLKASGRVVAMVGDGVNDAPALAAADVGIALGSGTDVAISFADITLVGSRLEAVARALKLSEKSLRTIKQNLWWAFGYNLLAIPIAAGLFYPGLGILLSPVVASAAMALSSLFVVTNSLRLRHIRL